MSKSSTNVNTSQQRAGRGQSLTARHGVGYKPADRPFERGLIKELDWRAYKLAVRWCRWGDHNTRSNAEYAEELGCDADTMSIVWRRLAAQNLIRRERAGNVYRTFVLAFVEAEPEPAAEVVASPAETRASLILGAVLLLQRAAELCEPSSVEPVAEPARPARPETESAPSEAAAGISPAPFFAPSASDPESGRSRSEIETPPITVNSMPYGMFNLASSSGSSLRSDPELPPRPGGGVGKFALGFGRSGRETETASRLRAFGVRSRGVRQRHADRPLAEVERLILAVEHWDVIEPVDDPGALLAVLLDEGLWPSRAAQIEAALAAASAKRATRCASCGRADPLLWQSPVCRCGQPVAFTGVADPSVVVADPEPCARCWSEPVSAVGEVCGRCKVAGLDRDLARLLVERWGSGVASVAPVPSWLLEAAGGD